MVSFRWCSNAFSISKPRSPHLAHLLGSLGLPEIPSDELIRFAAALFTAAGVNNDEARQVATSLVEANLRGHDSHGVVRIPPYIRLLRQGELVPGAPLEVLRETPALAACDAHLGFGQVQARRLTELAIEKARAVGIGCGTARNCGHIGRLGEYTELAAAQGLAAFMTVNDNGVLRVVAPPGGLEPRISTNPLSLAVPTGDGPLVFDASTSVVAQGKVLVRRVSGQPCPEGWLQDAAGQPTTDPGVLRADPPGTILPLGGPAAFKGFGLGVMLDILAGGLSGGFCPPPRDEARDANTVLITVWDPQQFAGREHLLRQADGLIASIRSCPRKPGVDSIELPGDTSRRVRDDRLRRGIPLDAGTWRRLTDLAAELGVPLQRESFLWQA
jgi:uncharacterized oxidoreductase